MNIMVKHDCAITTYTPTSEELLQRGMVNIDKPKGPTSHQISAYVQRILSLEKSGHSGTLDPGVTGVLPVALGGSTKVIQALLKAGKSYVVVMHLHKPVEEKKLRKAMKNMTGMIAQLPPKKSAVKRRRRFRKVYEAEILEIEGQDVLFTMDCEAGTYVRKYVHDLGQLLKVGAHMQCLRRIRAGPYDESTLVTLQDLADAYHYYQEGDDALLRKAIQPLETAVTHIPWVWVNDACTQAISNGVDVYAPGIVQLHEGIEPDQLVAVMSTDQRLLALGTAQLTSKKMVEAEEGVVVSTDKVFIGNI